MHSAKHSSGPVHRVFLHMMNADLRYQSSEVLVPLPVPKRCCAPMLLGSASSLQKS